uniref:DNA repair metallo-beta-lactamase domain-containing protein n=2 Tax=Opuntia streptacantha TaxID=393608 RepID=A0A7C9FCW4_OPUST
MPIEMPRGLPFSVDTWSPNSKMRRHHFLTHAHKDHCSGIISYSSFPIYSTRVTKSLLLRYFPQLDESLFVGIEVGQSLTIDDPDGSFLVTAFDANHCPGAVMFLFEGSFGSILHTGDCRLTPECLQNLPEKYLSRLGKKPSCQLDFIFLDCTFGKSLMKIPSKQSAIQQVSNCIWKNPDAPTVYLTCDLLGQEEILVHVFKTFGSRIYVDKDNHSEFYKVLELIAPELLSDDPSSRFHLFEGFPKLYERAKRKLSEAREKMEPEPLIIRPSAQWYACGETELTVMEKKILERSNVPVKDQFAVWHICYSMHSSRQELEWALELLAPKWVVSTTPECRAMELEYVKKHCFDTHASDTLFWKLLDISGTTSPKADVFTESSKCFSLAETADAVSEEFQLQQPEILSNKRILLSFSPLRKKPTVTLFGHARLGYDSCISDMATATHCGSSRSILFEDIKAAPAVTALNMGLQTSQKKCSCPQNVTNEGEKPSEGETDIGATETECEQLRGRHSVVCKSVSYSSSRPPYGFNENLRKLYRSMNAPVPQPLPSLVELMKGLKRSKKRS